MQSFVMTTTMYDDATAACGMCSWVSVSISVEDTVLRNMPLRRVEKNDFVLSSMLG